MKVTQPELIATVEILKGLRRANRNGYRLPWKRALLHAVQILGQLSDQEISELRTALRLP